MSLGGIHRGCYLCSFLLNRGQQMLTIVSQHFRHVAPTPIPPAPCLSRFSALLSSFFILSRDLQHVFHFEICRASEIMPQAQSDLLHLEHRPFSGQSSSEQETQLRISF